MDDTTRDRIEAAAFRKLLELLRRRTDVQNIDLMGTSGFCRNCLSDWIGEAAMEAGNPMTKGEAREHVYGMSYEDYRARHQTDATPEQLERMAASVKRNQILDDALGDSFPASDPPSASEPG